MNSPCDMLVFGGTGDLALHKLLPALYHLHRDGRLPTDMRILAAARNVLNRAEYQALAERQGGVVGAADDPGGVEVVRAGVEADGPGPGERGVGVGC